MHLPHYRYFLPGYFVKLAGTVMFCAVYVFYYTDGDSIDFFRAAGCLYRELFIHPSVFLRVFFCGDVSMDTLIDFNAHFFLPINVNERFNLFLVRLITPLYIISFGHFLTASLMLSTLCYSGVWKLYTVFCERYPALKKEMAVAVLCIPSVVFWGSGLLKDTVVFSAMGWLVYTLHRLAQSRFSLSAFVSLTVSCFIILSIKPYVLYALLLASAIAVAAILLKKIPTRVERFFYSPLVILFFVAAGGLLVFGVGKNQDRFSLQQSASELVVLHVATNANSSFQRASIEKSFSGILKSAPADIVLSLFRPYVWEAKGIIPFFISIEMLLLLLFFLRVVVKLRLLFLFRFLFEEAFLVFAFTFILTLSFMVGFATDNFGTLDRFRIPLMPFYLMLCLVLNTKTVPTATPSPRFSEA